MEEKHQNDTHKEKKPKRKLRIDCIIGLVAIIIFGVIGLVGFLLTAVWGYIVIGTVLLLVGLIICIIVGTYFFLKYHC